jgi:hypothetical protein
MARRGLILVEWPPEQPGKPGRAGGFPYSGPRREAWIELPLDDAWLAAFRLAVRDGQVVVAELRVFPNEPDDSEAVNVLFGGDRPPGRWSAEVLGDKAAVPAGGLTARTLRRVRFEEALRVSQELLTRVLMAEGRERELFGPGGLLARHGLDVLPEARSRRGQRAMSSAERERYLAAVAAEYAGLVAAGERVPTAVLAGRLHYTAGRVRQLLAEARRRGLLTGTQRGRAGGTLTDKARALLAQREEET